MHLYHENEREVLAYINGLREQYGIGDPLSAMPPDMTAEQVDVSLNCPVAVALGKRCGLSVVLGGELVVFPHFVREFIVNHDQLLIQKKNATE